MTKLTKDNIRVEGKLSAIIHVGNEQLRDEILEALELKRLIKERKNNLPECWSKECMGCEWDLVRNELEKLESKAKEVNK